MQCRRVRYTERSRAWRVGDLLGGFVTGPDNQFLQLAKGLGEVVATLPKLLILSLERAHSLVEPAGLTLQLLEFTKTGGKRHEKTLGLFDPEHELLLNLGARFLFAIHLLPAFQFSMSPGFRVECGTRCPRQALEARRNGESRGGSTADGVRPSVAGCSWSPREEPVRRRAPIPGAPIHSDFHGLHPRERALEKIIEGRLVLGRDHEIGRVWRTKLCEVVPPRR